MATPRPDKLGRSGEASHAAAALQRLLRRGHRVSTPEPHQPAAHDETPPSEAPPPPASPRRILDSQELLAGEQEVLIQNGDEIYRLRRTRAGKLILYK